MNRSPTAAGGRIGRSSSTNAQTLARARQTAQQRRLQLLVSFAGGRKTRDHRAHAAVRVASRQLPAAGAVPSTAASHAGRRGAAGSRPAGPRRRPRRRSSSGARCCWREWRACVALVRHVAQLRPAAVCWPARTAAKQARREPEAARDAGGRAAWRDRSSRRGGARGAGAARARARPPHPGCVGLPGVAGCCGVHSTLPACRSVATPYALT